MSVTTTAWNEELVNDGSLQSDLSEKEGQA